MPRKIALATEEIDINLTSVELHGSPEDVAAENIDIVSFSTERTTNGMRASSLYDCCVRHVVLATKSPVPVRERLDLGLRLTFEIGNAIHHHIQNTGMIFGDNRYGYWTCGYCGGIQAFGPPPKGMCRHAEHGPDVFLYQEKQVVTHRPYPCSGHPDLFIRKRNNALRVVELKTISADGFQKLSAPDIGHVWQIQYYMWACSQDKLMNDDFDPNVGYILYISKGMLFKKLPLKMFVEKRNPRIIEQIQEKLLTFQEGMTSDELPEALPECKRSMFKRGRALGCPSVMECSKKV